LKATYLLTYLFTIAQQNNTMKCNAMKKISYQPYKSDVGKISPIGILGGRDECKICSS